MIDHTIFMNIAAEVAEASHCVSLHVGAVIVKDSRIISTGYNGTTPGYTNCDDIFEGSCPEHSAWSQAHEIHAEMNAIIFAAKAGISIEGADMYSTTSPCRQCLKHLKQAGIAHIYFRHLYSRTSQEQHEEDILFCKEIGLAITHLPK